MTEPYLGLLPTPLAELAPYVEDGVIGDMFYDSLTEDQRILQFFTSDPAGVRTFPGQVGQRIAMTRDAEHNPNPEPSVAGSNPTPSTHLAEQFLVKPQQYDGLIYLDSLTNYLAKGNRAMRETNNFVKSNAAKKMDGIAARAAYGTYNGGHTVAINTVVGGTNLRVASINGFTDLVDTNGEVVTVSVAKPKYINLAGTVVQISAAVADDPVNDAFGAGTLTLTANASWSATDYVIAMDAPAVYYAGGGNSVDAISASDTLTYNDVLTVVAELRAQGTRPFSDGLYRAFLDPVQEMTLLKDPKIESNISHRGLSEGIDPEVAKATIVIAAGVRFMRCNTVPDINTATNLGYTVTGKRTGATFSKQIWAEVANASGVPIKRLLVFGMGCGELHYIPVQSVVPAADMIGSTVTPAMTAASAEGVFVWPQPWLRFKYRVEPGDIHGLKTSLSYLAFLDTVCPSDQYGGYTGKANMATTRNPRHKRAASVLHA